MRCGMVQNIQYLIFRYTSLSEDFLLILSPWWLSSEPN